MRTAAPAGACSQGKHSVPVSFLQVSHASRRITAWFTRIAVHSLWLLVCPRSPQRQVSEHVGLCPDQDGQFSIRIFLADTCLKCTISNDASITCSKRVFCHLWSFLFKLAGAPTTPVVWRGAPPPTKLNLNLCTY